MKIRSLKDNRGLSLVEMLIATTILSIVMAGVFTIMSQMTNSLGRSQREVMVQDELQTSYTVLSTLIKEAQVIDHNPTDNISRKALVTYNHSDGDVQYFILSEESDADRNLREQKYAKQIATVHILDYDKAHNTVYVYEDYYDTDDQGINGSSFDQTTFENFLKAMYNADQAAKLVRIDANIVSKHVDSISIDDNGDYYTLNLKIVNKDRTADVNQNIFIRNSESWTKTVTATPTPSGGATGTDTPTPETTVTTMPEGGPFIVTNGGGTTLPGSDTIDLFNDLPVRYGTDVKHPTPTPVLEDVYEYTCPNGHALQSEGYNWFNADGAIENRQYYLWHCSNWCHVGGNQRYYSLTDDITTAKAKDGSKPTKTKTGTREVSHCETEDYILIQNQSLDTKYTNVEVIVYFQDNNTYFEKNAAGEYLTGNTRLTTGGGSCYYYPITKDGKVKGMKIVIPAMQIAESGDGGSAQGYSYCQYCFNYIPSQKAGNNVLCTYSVKGVKAS